MASNEVIDESVKTALLALQKVMESPEFQKALQDQERRYTFSAQLTAKQIVAVVTLLESNT